MTCIIKERLHYNATTDHDEILDILFRTGRVCVHLKTMIDVYLPALLKPISTTIAQIILEAFIYPT